MKLGMIYTVLGVITAELIAGGRGLGTLVSYYSNTFDTNGVFAVLILLILLTSSLAVTTLGERAEDVFHVTDDGGRPLGEDARARLQEQLTATLDRRDGSSPA